MCLIVIESCYNTYIYGFQDRLCTRKVLNFLNILNKFMQDHLSQHQSYIGHRIPRDYSQCVKSTCIFEIEIHALTYNQIF